MELRKSFDTRSGFWLLASIGIASVLTTGAVIAWAPKNELTYSQFTLAIGVPISIILPIIATLSVTAEWTQRSGLATFTLVPAPTAAYFSPRPSPRYSLQRSRLPSPSPSVRWATSSAPPSPGSLAYGTRA